MPVSAIRAERDAIANAATAGAMRRKLRGNDPLQFARRIGAALSAESADFGFCWVTGVTADGATVVANSYGIGYIPEGVNLPEKVRMVTADEAIPAVQLADWATYPVLAVQGWAQHHGTTLRAVIATDAQFQGTDPGVRKITLEPDDIPKSGKMQGRSRLAVIAPESAACLAAAGDGNLTELLPAASADINPPADETNALWWEVIKPLMSTVPGRNVAHLRAFVSYSDHVRELALYRAHRAPDTAAQRAAIADWMYWQHLGVLMASSLAESARTPAR